MRTIEVVPKEDPITRKHKGWTIQGSEYGRHNYATKKKAVKAARQIAKREARRYGESMGLKIFGKDGEYQRQHVYDP